MSGVRVVVLTMPEHGHFQLLSPVIGGLREHGARVTVFGEPAYGPTAARLGAGFETLDVAGRLRELGDGSTPLPCRYVTYAAFEHRSLAERIGQLEPELIVAESFAVVAPVVARTLEVPWVNLSPGHDLDPARLSRELESDPRVHVSAVCRRAVDMLRDGGLYAGPGPFLYATNTSPWLNLSCEPPSFVSEQTRRCLTPLVHFGAGMGTRPRRSAPAAFSDTGALRVYASFGTVVWRYYHNAALAALRELRNWARTRSDVELLVSLGHARVTDEERGNLSADNVRVASWVDQPAVLAEADLFVTHHGINSTHEAIAAGVPMISYPFFWDQPSLARTCQNLGLAVPLADGLRDSVTVECIQRALSTVQASRARMRRSLERAGAEQAEVVAGRDRVIERMLALAPVSRYRPISPPPPGLPEGHVDDPGGKE